MKSSVGFFLGLAVVTFTLGVDFPAQARGRKTAHHRGGAHRQADRARTDPGHVFDGRRAKPDPLDARGVKPWRRGEREREWRKPRVQQPRRRRAPPPPPPRHR